MNKELTMDWVHDREHIQIYNEIIAKREIDIKIEMNGAFDTNVSVFLKSA